MTTSRQEGAPGVGWHVNSAGEPTTGEPTFTDHSRWPSWQARPNTRPAVEAATIPPHPGAATSELGSTIGDATTLPPSSRDHVGAPVLASNARTVPSLDPTTTCSTAVGLPAAPTVVQAANAADDTTCPPMSAIQITAPV